MGADVDESNASQHEEAGEEGWVKHKEAKEGCHLTQYEEDTCSPTQREEGGGRVRENTMRSANQHDDSGNCSTAVTRQ